MGLCSFDRNKYGFKSNYKQQAYDVNIMSFLLWVLFWFFFVPYIKFLLSELQNTHGLSGRAPSMENHQLVFSI